jgi:dephospho-CoA kinase
MAKKIGITGGMGTGKSIVCDVFAILGIPVYSADDRAKFLIENESVLKNNIIDLLGPNAYLEDGKYNKKWVAAQVFSDKFLLEKLNRLVHPCVATDTDAWYKENYNARYVLREAALVNNLSQLNLDALIVVSAPIEVRIKRIQQRDPHRSLTEIENIIARQKTDEEFNQLADYHIINDEKNLIIPQVLRIDEEINRLMIG